MKKILLFMAICHAFTCTAQGVKDIVLYGPVDKGSLVLDPQQPWFLKNYEAYHTSSDIKKSLAGLSVKGIEIEVYFGSWCGDSKREVPRFSKMLDEIGFSKKQWTLIGLGSSDSLYKQSPGGEEKGKGIFRVPVFIVYKNGKEIGRINEYPVESLERDFLSILQNQPYTPNYKSFHIITQWLNDGMLLDSNISVRGLAGKIKPLAENEYEINTVARLLLKQGKQKEAFKLFSVNAIMFPSSTTVITSLAEAYLEMGQKKEAIALLEKNLETKSPEAPKTWIDLLVRAKRE